MKFGERSWDIPTGFVRIIILFDLHGDDEKVWGYVGTNGETLCV
jgi:hypothetical protein